MGRLGHAKGFQDGGGQICQGRAVSGQGLVGEQHSRHLQGIDAVVTVPVLGVVLQHSLAGHALGGVPGGPVAAVVTHDEVWGVLEVGAVIERVHVKDLADGPPRALWIFQAGQPAGDLCTQRGRGLGRDAAPGLAPLEVEEDAGQPQGIGPGARPVHPLQIFPHLPAPLLQHQVALLHQPGVQVHPPGEGGEAVVGDHQQQGLRVVRVHLLQHPLQHGVAVGVDVLDGPGVLALSPLMILHEHVLDAVGAVEHTGTEPAPLPPQKLREHLLALCLVEHGLLEEALLVQHILVEGPGVLGQPQGGVAAQELGEEDREGQRVGQGHAGPVRRDVDRGDVQLKRIQAPQPEAADAPQLEPGHQGKLHLHPVAVLPLLEVHALPAHFEPGALTAGLQGHLQRGAQGALLPAQGIWRAPEPALHQIVMDLHRVDPPDHALGLVLLAGVEGERSLGAQQVWRAHG